MNVKGKKIGQYLLFVMVITISLCMVTNNNIETLEGESLSPNEDQKFNTSAYWDNFTLIYINNNWTNAVNWGWCKGDGSWATPYVLENITIDATKANSCIIIEDSTDDYFIINNCTLYNSVQSGDYAGIKLNNVQNGTIMDSYIYANSYGIWMNTTENITISNCRIQNNKNDGIYLKDSIKNFIEDNIIKSNDGNGLYFIDSDYNNITDLNHIRNNDLFGLRFNAGSNNNLIQENYIGYNLEGCYKDDGTNNDFVENDCVGDYDEDPVYGDLDDEEISIAGYELALIPLIIAGFGVIIYFRKLRNRIW